MTELTVEECPDPRCEGVIRYDLAQRTNQTRVQCEPRDLAHSQVVCRSWWWFDAAGEDWELDPNHPPDVQEVEPGELPW